MDIIRHINQKKMKLQIVERGNNMDTVKLNLPGVDEFFTQESYKVFRTNLQFCGQDINAITITSCNENEGKTTIALHIAKSFSDLGKRVLLIDADMRKSVMVRRNTDANVVCGLSEVLTGMASLSECVFATQYENMHILFSGKYPPNPVELLNGKHFAVLLREIRNIYDYIIIDTPPLGQVIDAAIVAAQCDGTVLVLDDGKVHYRQAQRVLYQLEKSECKVLGAVLNNTKRRRKAYYKSKKYGE